MNIKYFFIIYVIVLIFSSIVQASDRADLHEEASVLITSAVSKTDSCFNRQVNSLLNEVVIPAYPSDHGIFWKSVTSIFQKAKLVYTKLGQYLYASIFSVFNW
ncbi:hypothetical protein V4P56_00495 [Bartonella sp. B35(2025)]